ncbi:TetR/AcrR family transcriptional regulator [Thiomicrorhabdus sp.]|uniref:TetR/AcrR family transcriptional regulator n=1 Tax=Thiomicrorhabdus sp. TaxID=2039724 RepID=UPI0029C76E36|nr:TetR/AcrR family transcriptional regulator [Thiomicrorhabdus sp.]
MSVNHPGAAKSYTGKKVRERLPGETRIQQILDAALIEFSAKGFTLTKVDDIAKRAGLSKGGLYNYFSSKEQIFESLLIERIPSFELDVDKIIGQATSCSELVELFLERYYAYLRDEDNIAILRLLIAEGGRLSDYLKRWREEYHRSVSSSLDRLMQQSIDSGVCDCRIFENRTWLILSPIVHVAVMQLIMGKDSYKSLEECHQDHQVLLSELLRFR